MAANPAELKAAINAVVSQIQESQAGLHLAGERLGAALLGGIAATRGSSHVDTGNALAAIRLATEKVDEAMGSTTDAITAYQGYIAGL